MDKKWQSIDLKIKQKHADYVVPAQPFRVNNLIRDFNGLYAKIYDKEKFVSA